MIEAAISTGDRVYAMLEDSQGEYAAIGRIRDVLPHFMGGGVSYSFEGYDRQGFPIIISLSFDKLIKVEDLRQALSK